MQTDIGPARSLMEQRSSVTKIFTTVALPFLLLPIAAQITSELAPFGLLIGSA